MSQDTLTKLITAVINILNLQLGYVSPLVSLSSSFVIINRLTYTLLLFPNTEPMFRPASVIIIYLHKNIFILSLLFIYQLNGFQNNGICCCDWSYFHLNVQIQKKKNRYVLYLANIRIHFHGDRRRLRLHHSIEKAWRLLHCC